MVKDLFEPVDVIEEISQKAIDDAVKDNPECNREFVWIAIREDLRSQVNSRWAEVSQFCEDDFVDAFRSKEGFHSRLWELNLRYLFRDHLGRMPADGEPDLISESFNIECVVPDPTDVPDMIFDMQARQYPTEQIERRVTAAWVEKVNQYDRRLKNDSSLDYNNTPYIIAIGLPQREFRDAKSMSGLDIVETVMIGAGPLQLTLPNDGTTANISVSSRPTIESRNQSEFDIAYFQRDEFKNISGVMWSTELIPELNDIKLMVNPKCDTSIELELFGVKIISYTKGEDGYSRDQPNEGWS